MSAICSQTTPAMFGALGNISASKAASPSTAGVTTRCRGTTAKGRLKLPILSRSGHRMPHRPYMATHQRNGARRTGPLQERTTTRRRWKLKLSLGHPTSSRRLAGGQFTSWASTTAFTHSHLTTRASNTTAARGQCIWATSTKSLTQRVSATAAVHGQPIRASTTSGRGASITVRARSRLDRLCNRPRSNAWTTSELSPKLPSSAPYRRSGRRSAMVLGREAGSEGGAILSSMGWWCPRSPRSCIRRQTETIRASRTGRHTRHPDGTYFSTMALPMICARSSGASKPR
mmetsp:Transcript_22037/g.61713  ORF Transcript_22037/g.61713 Transcript_22037/m.61713 type:complete len:288 (+) Transcript_22037:171-1034(+)